MGSESSLISMCGKRMLYWCAGKDDFSCIVPSSGMPIRSGVEQTSQSFSQIGSGHFLQSFRHSEISEKCAEPVITNRRMRECKISLLFLTSFPRSSLAYAHPTINSICKVNCCSCFVQQYFFLLYNYTSESHLKNTKLYDLWLNTKFKI